MPNSCVTPIWRPGWFIADTGTQLDDAAVASGVYADQRSNRGGSEPEGIDLIRFSGLTLAAVGLERADAIALVDLSDPTSPRVLHVAGLQGGIGPETVKFFRRGSLLAVVSGNEVSGTLSILRWCSGRGQAFWGCAMRVVCQPGGVQDNTTAAGRLQLRKLGAFADFERGRITERVHAGIARARQQGKRFGPVSR